MANNRGAEFLSELRDELTKRGCPTEMRLLIEDEFGTYDTCRASGFSVKEALRQTMFAARSREKNGPIDDTERRIIDDIVNADPSSAMATMLVIAGAIASGGIRSPEHVAMVKCGREAVTELKAAKKSYERGKLDNAWNHLKEAAIAWEKRRVYRGGWLAQKASLLALPEQPAPQVKASDLRGPLAQPMRVNSRQDVIDTIAKGISSAFRPFAGSEVPADEPITMDFVRKAMVVKGRETMIDHTKLIQEMERQFGPKFVSTFVNYCALQAGGAPAPSSTAGLNMYEQKIAQLEGQMRELDMTWRQNVERQKLQDMQMAQGKQKMLDEAQAALKKYMEEFARLKKSACPHANVVKLNGETVGIVSGGRSIEVEWPKTPTGGLIPLSPGDTVRVTGDTMQIIDRVDSATAGEVLNVHRVVDEKTVEVDRQGSQRAVAYSKNSFSLEEMDRVVLDQSGSVVIANLGKPADMGLVEEATGVCWDDIGGLEQAKRELREAIEAPILHAAKLAKYGKRAAKGALLYGGPGLGKTMLGKAAATALAELHAKTVTQCRECRCFSDDPLTPELCLDRILSGNGGPPHQWVTIKTLTPGGFFYVKGPQMLDKFVGETEASIRKLFAQARAYKKKHGFPAIIFIDEAEAILGPRNSGRETTKGFLSQTVVPQFLSEMDGLEDSGAFVLLATNRPSSIDSAIVRDGRIDRRIKVSRPGKEDAKAILSKHLGRTPLTMPQEEAIDVVVETLYDPKLVLYRVKKRTSVGKGVAMTLGHMVSGAMLAGVVDRATSYAMRRELEAEVVEGYDEVARVTETDLREAVHAVLREARDVNHDDELQEFTDGWMHEVEAITRESHLAPAPMANAS